MNRNYFIASFVGCLAFVASCTEASTASSETAFVGSTPGDATIKTMLGIDVSKPVDFIRWHLVLREQSKSFVMSARYGVGKPNTPDFEGGGEKLGFLGSYDRSREGKKEIYRLTSKSLPGPISIVRLNDDLFHVLSPEKRLMVGTGGWSYTLSSNRPSTQRSAGLPSIARVVTSKQADEIVFVGRTPCAEIAREYKWPVGNECSKLKWKLTLRRDPKTGEPSTYTLQRTLHRTGPIEGVWSIVKGTKTDPQALIYRLDPDKPESSITFLVGEENVMFFLDKEGRMFGGNADFSYTLNRRNE
jgi:hypothetical protein